MSYLLWLPFIFQHIIIIVACHSCPDLKPTCTISWPHPFSSVFAPNIGQNLFCYSKARRWAAILGSIIHKFLKKLYMRFWKIGLVGLIWNWSRHPNCRFLRPIFTLYNTYQPSFEQNCTLFTSKFSFMEFAVNLVEFCLFSTFGKTEISS